MITVAAALIEHKGRLLVCQRRRNAPFELQWEFPGGKVQANESAERALARELKEELGADLLESREIYRTRYRYPELTDELELIFFLTRVEPKTIRNRVFAAMRWVKLQGLSEFNFLPGDRELVRRLSRGEVVPAFASKRHDRPEERQSASPQG